jgi:prepilin-type N-terminal cleavage/methylation domain-containing protein
MAVIKHIFLKQAHESKEIGSYLRINNRSTNGFTLLEVLVSIIIIGILAAITVPSWLGFVNTQRLRTAQDEVYLAIRQAQSQAIKNKLTWQVSFREQNGTVQWAVHPATVNPADVIWNNLDPNMRLDAETSLQQENGGHIQFDYRGNVNPPLRRITLSSRNGAKAKRCVYISTILGAIRTAKEQEKPDSYGKYCY